MDQKCKRFRWIRNFAFIFDGATLFTDSKLSLVVALRLESLSRPRVNFGTSEKFVKVRIHKIKKKLYFKALLNDFFNIF